MTTAQLVADLKSRIGRGNPMTDPQLLVWINEAYMYVCDAISKANPDYFSRSSLAQTVAGYNEYVLPDDYDGMLLVNINYGDGFVQAKPLQNIGLTGALARTGTDHGYSTGDPVYYLTNNDIGFLPIPSLTLTNAIKIWHKFIPDELSDSNESPAIPKKFHHILVVGAYSNFLHEDDQHAAGEAMWDRFERRVADLVESTSDTNLDSPKSIVVTDNQDLYFDDEYLI